MIILYNDSNDYQASKFHLIQITNFFCAVIYLVLFFWLRNGKKFAENFIENIIADAATVVAAAATVQTFVSACVDVFYFVD